MEVAQETSSSSKKKVEKSDSSGDGAVNKSDAKNSEKKSDSDDSKPRIVLTFRSEKGVKSNMKIVQTEEKSDEVSPRRSGRTRGVDVDSHNRVFPNYKMACDMVGKSPKKGSQHYESEENSDSSHSQTPKRATRRRSRDFDNVIANAITRKEKSYNEAPAPSRPSRRIKPTAKVLENEELRIEMESSRTKVSTDIEKSLEEGVRTRGSYRKQTVSANEDSRDKTESKNKDDGETQNEVMKLKHLCELGLKAKSPEDGQLESTEKDNEEPIEIDDDDDEALEDEEIDDDTEVISKLLEADNDSSNSEEWYDSGECVEEYTRKSERAAPHRPRPKRRSTRYENDSDCSLPISGDDHAPRRRSLRKRNPASLNEDYVQQFCPKQKRSRPVRSVPQEESHCDEEHEEMSDVADGEEGTEADTPPDKNEVIATCSCEAPSNTYAAAGDLPEPVFCQAVETVDGVRVGCSHPASKEGSSYAPLLRAGLRAPYFLACKLHSAQLKKHMCCPVCGLFCTQGIFYQCSEKHLFHIDCALPYNTNKERLGCPHCGVYSYGWQPANKQCCRVKVEMQCSNERIFLPEQREQCTPAYPSFSSLPPPRAASPLIPEDMLPSLPADVKALGMCKEGTDVSSLKLADSICEALLAGRLLDVTQAATDERQAPTLVRTVKALLEKSETCSPKKIKEDIDQDTEDTDSSKKDKKESDQEDAANVDVDKGEQEGKIEKEGEGDTEAKGGESETKKPSDEELMKAIRYLVAAGCDVNIPDAEGMTALHVAAQHGSAEVCALLVAGGACVDPRDLGGWTPLVWAAEHTHPDVVRLLLREGADATAVDNEGNAVIHWCALAGCAQSLHMLLSSAPDQLHATNTHGDTPLHVAARQGHYACVVILLARGARADVENTEGQLPADVCAGAGACHSAIVFNARMRREAHGDAPPLRILSNDISNGAERHPVPCVNEADDAPLPDEFTYVAANVLPAPLAVDSTVRSLQGCNCKDGNCSTDSCGCCALSVGAWWVRGRLRRHFPHHQPPALLHCTPLCACNKKKCQNSTITRLSTSGALFIRAEVFRCGGARGWGLRATQHVLRGTPVALYTGELLKATEADARATDQYMFALDCKPDLLEQYSDKGLLCVDAAKYGSASRFMNHSCAANVSPVRVLSGTRDLRAPLVALFAVRDIAAREELTFDYGDKFWSVKAKYMKCECGTPECRYPNIIEDLES